MLLGFAANGIVSQEKGQYVVAIVLGVYGIFVTGHATIDIMATKTVVKKTTEEEGAWAAPATPTRRTTGCPNGRNRGVCHPGKPEPKARNRRRIQKDRDER